MGRKNTIKITSRLLQTHRHPAGGFFIPAPPVGFSSPDETTNKRRPK
jgi:hypothetical protein